MASIYRYYDGLGRGEFLSRTSHPSGKIKKEKAEIFSFHQNRKELGEVGDGRRDEGWRPRCALQPVVVFGEGSPPAGHLHSGPRGTRTGAACPPVWASLAAPGVFVLSHPQAHVPSWAQYTDADMHKTHVPLVPSHT